MEARAALARKALPKFLAAIPVLAAVFFIPAGTLDYWQAWVYSAIVLVPLLFVVAYFLKNDPALLERRMHMKERAKGQSAIIKMATLIITIGFLLPGLDRRFGWSHVPAELSLAADVLVFLGYALVFLVFKENSYASRIIEVAKGQKVISTGPYAVVRHPMYAGFLVMYIATPIALGSYWALPVFLLLVPAMVLRIRGEEKLLRSELPGYSEYCKRVRYRLVPGLW
jgi:protein-S-isoprenylcysteine O-methyltransferase Ste14